MYDYLHLNTKGSEKVAKIITESLFINYEDLLVSIILNSAIIYLLFKITYF